MDNRNYLAGIGLLLIVVFLWTFSNFLTQDLFEEGYDKPFLVTYLNTSSFTLYLLPFLFKYYRDKRHNASIEGLEQYEALPEAEPIFAPTTSGTNEISETQADRDDTLIKPEDDSHQLPPLTTRQTINLASIFCFFWFIANWTVNASLRYTSVGSSTVLASTSGLFTLVVGRLLGVESLTVSKIGAVITSFAGVILVSLADSKYSKSPESTDVRPPPPNPLLGDTLALLSAIFYALYVSLLKVRIKNESRINMQLFFGFVGLFNVLACWPVGVLLHWFGVESFGFPQTGKTWLGVGINMAVTLTSDFIYVIAMLKTTPLVVTIGLSLTIPLAVFGDFVLGRDATIKGLIGALLVLISFGVVGLEDARQEEPPEALVHVGNLEGGVDAEDRGILLRDDRRASEDHEIGEHQERGRSRTR